MMVAVEIRRRLPLVVWPLVAISLMAYFGYHLVEGERGLKAWKRLTQEIAGAKTRLSRLEAERQVLERDVALLRPEHIDRDMLDERVRAVLNLGGADEIVIFSKPSPR